MKKPNEKIILNALEFASRWGFLKKNIFFEFLCPKNRAQNYRYWAHLVEAGYFEKSKFNSDNLILSKSSRKSMGGEIRPARSHFYIEHDEQVARIFLSLKNRDLIENWWLEDDFARDRELAVELFGTYSIHRLPDLVFDLKRKSGQRPYRCALEVERTTKSQVRYTKMAMAYEDMKRIEWILIAFDKEATANQVRHAFNTKNLIEKNKIPCLFEYKNFDAENLQTEVRISNTTRTFENILEILTESPVPKLRTRPNSNENQVSSVQELQKASA